MIVGDITNGKLVKELRFSLYLYLSRLFSVSHLSVCLCLLSVSLLPSLSSLSPLPFLPSLSSSSLWILPAGFLFLLRLQLLC